jgi:hypothetical protein
MLTTKPQHDDQLIRQVINQSIVSQAILVAHDIGLFEALGHQEKSLVEICQTLSLPKKSAFALLTLGIQCKLASFHNDLYKLTDYAKEYLLKESNLYFGDVLDLIIQQNAVRSYDSIKTSVMNGQPTIYQGKELFETHETDLQRLEAFTKAMHGKSIGAAMSWPNHTDLAESKMLLDIGGGAGTHAIYACKKWPSLQSIIFERPIVCEIAEKYIKKYEMSKQIVAKSGDMWHDPFPQADVHFYSDIFHDWPEEKVHFLTEKSFQSLPRGGRIIIHEMLFDDQKIGPFNVAAYNLNMLLWTTGQQFSDQEIKDILRKTGFIGVKTHKTFGDWHIVVGEKP